ANGNRRADRHARRGAGRGHPPGRGLDRRTDERDKLDAGATRMKTCERIEENRTARFGESEVGFILRRSSMRRSVALQIDERGLTVSVPWRCSEGRLQQVRRDAEPWVLRKLAVWSGDRPPPPTWRNGEQLPF